MYNINDCVLVRKTSNLPLDGVIETPVHGRAYSFGTSSLMGEAINRKLRAKYKDFDEFLMHLHLYDIYYETYRSTIHFAIDGIVQNSVYGEFDYPYAILEPLKYHIDEPSLETLRVEDTYFSDDVVLSDECVILVPEDEYDRVISSTSLDSKCIKPYSGNIEVAIEEEIKRLGYPFFDVCDHGYRDGLDDGTESSKMYDFINSYAKEHGIAQTKHFYSEINHNDQNKRMEEADKNDLEHFKYILDSGFASKELVKKINDLLPNAYYYSHKFNELGEQLVDEGSLEVLLQLTTEFNNNKISERQNSKGIVK